LASYALSRATFNDTRPNGRDLLNVCEESVAIFVYVPI